MGVILGLSWSFGLKRKVWSFGFFLAARERDPPVQPCQNGVSTGLLPESYSAS